MKTKLLFLVSIIVSLGVYGETTITIGSTYGSQSYPFDIWYGYSRSASIYTSVEIGSSGLITSLGWNVITSDVESCPVKIYLQLTSNSALYGTTWTSLVSTATKVFDGSVTFSSIGWKTIDIADFVLLADQNLLVLCEVDYGGNGALSYPVFAYDYFPNQHEGWRQNETPPADPTTPDEKRPTIQVTYVNLSNPHPPSGFIAQEISTNQIDLTWTNNAANNNVMVAYNTVNIFGILTGSYVAGNSILGGGTVIYNGPAGSFFHITGLNPATTYYYMAWSVLPSTPTYSSGTQTSATTMCGVISSFPYSTDFESATFPPLGWSMAGKRWLKNNTVSAYGTGTGSSYADFYNSQIPIEATFDLVSPTLDLSSLSGPVISFDHAYATFDIQEDKLELWCSTNSGESYTHLYTWLGGATGPLNTGGTSGDPFVPTFGQWASKSYTLPAGTNKIRFRGVNAFGNNLYLDNIVIYEPIIEWNGGVSSLWTNPLNWTPNGVPSGTQNITIPAGKPYSPVVSTTGNECNSLVIQTGASLTVSSPAGGLTVMGNLTVQNGATLTNNGSVIIKGNLNNQNQN